MRQLYLTTEDIFALPYRKKQFIIYAPLLRIILVVNIDAAILISLIKKNKINWSNLNENNETIKKLLELGLLSRKKMIEKTTENIGVKFAPKSVTLCVTTDCNLRCLYCFASGGENPKYMKWNVAKAAIDICLKNIKNKENFQLYFSGGGEPTLAWNLIKKSISYCEKKCKNKKIKLSIHITTNGILSKQQISYIRQKKIEITLSIDGPPKIQNYLRPFKNGDPTYPSLKRTINSFTKLGICYGARATVTNFSIKDMLNIIKHFHALGIKRVHLEPSYECGRCLKTNIVNPSPDEFFKNFIKCLAYANKHKIDLHFSGQKIYALSSIFCGASGKSFYVTTDGFVTSCLEVLEITDPASKIFFYGKFNEKNKKFKIYNTKLKLLRSRLVNNIPKCNKCFCKWHCSGGCLIRCFRSSNSIFDVNHRICYINRKVGEYLIKQLVDGKKIVISKYNIVPDKI